MPAGDRQPKTEPPKGVAALPPSVRQRLERLMTEPGAGPGVQRSLFLLTAVVVGGTVGYMAIEGWSAWDALYMTVISITTAGYKEVHPLSRAGELFTMIVLTVGVATVLYTFSLVMARVVEGDLQHRWATRRRARMLDELTNHFIICGFGRIGRVISGELARQQVPLVVIERDPERVHEALEAGYLAVEADASGEQVLKRVGIGVARGLIAAVGSDAENVYAVLTARLLRPDLYIVARAETDDAKTKLVRAGANRVVSPYQIGGLQLAQTAVRPAVVDFVQIATSADHLELNIEQVEIGAGSELTGQSLVDSALRQRFGVVVVAIQRANGVMEFNPEPDTRIRQGDRLIALGRADDLRRLNAAAEAGVTGTGKPQAGR